MDQLNRPAKAGRSLTHGSQCSGFEPGEVEVTPTPSCQAIEVSTNDRRSASERVAARVFTDLESVPRDV